MEAAISDVDTYVNADVDVVVGVVDMYVDADVAATHQSLPHSTHLALLPLGPRSSIVGAIPVLLLESTILFTAVVSAKYTSVGRQ